MKPGTAPVQVGNPVPHFLAVTPALEGTGTSVQGQEASEGPHHFGSLAQVLRHVEQPVERREILGQDQGEPLRG
jgi:hypothetical protein